ncbi:hypothetical protein FB451DRAFT_77451 [Mycena latifolia]|nr:hypothetical protein FB451DRAFT_77451 [Mycena latifolia]
MCTTTVMGGGWRDAMRGGVRDTAYHREKRGRRYMPRYSCRGSSTSHGRRRVLQSDVGARDSPNRECGTRYRRTTGNVAEGYLPRHVLQARAYTSLVWRAPFRVAPRRLPGELRRRREGMLLLYRPRAAGGCSPRKPSSADGLYATSASPARHALPLSSAWRGYHPLRAASRPSARQRGCACCTCGWGRARPLAFFPGRSRCVVPTSRARRVLSFSGRGGYRRLRAAARPSAGGGDARAVPRFAR